MDKAQSIIALTKGKLEEFVDLEEDLKGKLDSSEGERRNLEVKIEELKQNLDNNSIGTLALEGRIQELEGVTTKCYKGKRISSG